MNDILCALKEEYARVLQEYVDGGREASLQHAYELGRRGLAEGMGVLEMVSLHYDVLVTVAARAPRPDEAGHIVKKAGEFLTEVLSPFEMTHRGFREANQALRQSEERYRSLVENAKDVIYTLSLDGTVTSLNPCFESITGWSRDDWLGKPFVPFVHPDDLPVAIESFRRVLRGDTPPILELRIQTKSGEYLHGEFTKTPLIKEGEVVGVLGIARDVTERKRAQEALRQSQEQLQATWQNSPAIMFIKDRQGRYLDVNPLFSKLTPLPREQILGRTDEEIFAPEQAAGFRAHDLTVFGENRPLEYEETMEHENGPRSSIVYKFPLRDAQGQPYAICGIVADITERRRAEEALRRLNQTLEDEAKRIAHALHDEAGQLLASVHMALDLVARELPARVCIKLEMVKDLLTQVEEQLRRLSHELRPTILDNLGLRPALEFLAQGVSHRTGLAIAVEGSTEGHLPSPIETALYRIVQEALNNATKHAQATRVTVRLLRDVQQVRCTVEDDGEGFDLPSVLARGRMQGLGLLGMRERIASVGGRLHIDSARGRGTKIEVDILLGGQDNAAPNHFSR